MSERDESTRPGFWNERYMRGDTPWSMDRVSVALGRFLSRAQSAHRVLIPGCGADHHSIRAFVRARFDVTAIDFSPVAVAKTRQVLGRQEGQKVISADFFEYQPKENFDLIYERTFLCALPPNRWQEYRRRVAELLNPGGLLLGSFFYGSETDPPPYPLTQAESQELFGTEFRLLRSEPVTDSVEMFAGMERWQEWERR